MDRLVERFMDQEGMNHLEGQRGVKNIAKLVNALGYQDFSRYGQQPGGYCLGDIFAFLEDNSGACEALVEWISSRRSPEWSEALKSRLVEDNEDDDGEEDDTEWDEMEPFFPNGIPDRI